MLESLLDKIYTKDKTEETMRETISIVSDALEKMKINSPEEYNGMVCHLEKYLYNIDKEEAEKIVSKMYNDNYNGGRWTYDQVLSVAEEKKLNENISRPDFYVVMNMWDSDYCETMKGLGLYDNIDAYVMFACQWLNDDDFGDGKVYKYFIKLHEGEED